MAESDRELALNQLRHSVNSLVCTVAAAQLLSSHRVEDLNGLRAVFRPAGVTVEDADGPREGARIECDLGQLAYDAAHRRSDFEATIEQLFLSVRRNVLKEAFEATLAFAQTRMITKEFKSEAWYPYARYIRNAISHDMRFGRFPSPTTSILHWETESLGPESAGKLMKSDVLRPHTLLSLVQAMKEFVERH